MEDISEFLGVLLPILDIEGDSVKLEIVTEFLDILGVSGGVELKVESLGRAAIGTYTLLFSEVLSDVTKVFACESLLTMLVLLLGWGSCEWLLSMDILLLLPI